MPIKTCLIVIAGRHPSSSFKMDKQMVPDGYTLGWKRGGTNLPVSIPTKRRQECEKLDDSLSIRLNTPRVIFNLTLTFRWF
jgi:hypothetical protein